MPDDDVKSTDQPKPKSEVKPTRVWQEIAQEASCEKDPQKLIELTAELDRALGERDKKRQQDATRKSA